MKKYLFLLLFVCSQVVGQTTLFQQDFNCAGPFESNTPNSGQFDSFTTYTNSSGASISIDNSQLKLTSNGGAYCYPPYFTYCIATTGTASANRTTLLSNNPYVLLHHKFLLSLNADAGYPGSGSSASFSFKFDSFTRTANSASGGGNTFTINNIEYDMNISKNIEVFANNTSISQLYTAPNGNSTTLTSGSYDIWVNNNRVKSATINNPQTLLSEFTFSTSAYSRAGITANIDDIIFESLTTTTPPPCPSTLSYQTLTDDFSSTPNPSLKKASLSITATNQITGNGTNVTYQAGNKVELNAGFKADNGTVFVAQIAGCN